MSFPVTLQWDCLVLVFKECDPSTLAVLGRVSLDVLRVTAPLLYRNVKIRSFEALSDLFLERRRKLKSESSRINASLSLSQIETLVIALDAMVQAKRVRLPHPLSLSRSIDFAPLPLKRLHITLLSATSASPLGIDQLFTNVLPHLNPLRASYHIQGQPRNWHFYTGSMLSSWTRLKQLETEGGWISRTVLDPPSLFGLDADDPRELIVHPPRIDGTLVTERLLVIMVMNDPQMFSMDTRRPSSIVLVVGSAEEKVETEAAIRTMVPQKWKAIFVVEAEP